MPLQGALSSSANLSTHVGQRPDAETYREDNAFNDIEEVTVAGSMQSPYQQETETHNQQSLEWDMSELGIQEAPHADMGDTVPKAVPTGVGIDLGRQDPEPTEKHTAPGMLPYQQHTQDTPHGRDSQEMTVSVGGHAQGDIYDDDVTVQRSGAISSPEDLRRTNPRSDQSMEHTFASAHPSSATINALANEAEQDSGVVGLTVPEVSTSSLFPNQGNPFRSQQSAEAEQPAVTSTPTREERMDISINLPANYAATEKQDVSMFRGVDEPPFDDESTTRQGPSESHNSRGYRPLPKPRLKPDFVFAEQLTLPSITRRAGAALIDVGLLSCLAFLTVWIFGPAVTKTMPANLHPLDILVFVLEHYSQHVGLGIGAFCVWYMLYSIIGLLAFQRTIGKALFGLVVVDRSGNKLGFLGILMRSLAFLPSFLLGLAGVSWILIDGEYRGLHDRVSGALVVRSNT